MYRDDPLDDEMELRGIVGDAAVERLEDAGDDLAADPVAVAVDALRLLQGWMPDEDAGHWFLQDQARLDGRTPIDALAAGMDDEVLDAARAYAAAHG